jgi:hypothetical protein
LLATLAFGASQLQAVEFCSSNPRVAAVDSSAPVDPRFLNQMQAMGINTIIRYYDHEDEPCQERLCDEANATQS